MPPDKGETFVEGHQIGCKILHEVTLSSGIVENFARETRSCACVVATVSIAWMTDLYPHGCQGPPIPSPAGFGGKAP